MRQGTSSEAATAASFLPGGGRQEVGVPKVWTLADSAREVKRAEIALTDCLRSTSQYGDTRART